MRSRKRVLTLLCLASLMSSAALAQTNANPDLEPGAAAALERMGAFMRTLTSFQVQATTTLDEVLTDGQKIQFRANVDLLVQRPDRLRAEVTGDRQQRFFFYDGKSFTLWARRLNFYATAPAPPTLAKLGELLADKYGIELPLSDLFYWGSTPADRDSLTAGFDVGPSQVGGTSCEHYAFRQSGADWQVWIQQGPYPLPRRLVITSTDDDARPAYTTEMTWNLAPSFNDAAFTFVPDSQTMKITFAELNSKK